MKGTVVKALEELVVSQFGKDKWQQSLEGAGLNKNTVFMTMVDVDDAAVMKVVESLCNVVGITLAQAADAFGDYWVNVYSQKLYKPYYANSRSAKEFLLKLNDVHVAMTKALKGARPPRFDYEWRGEKTLIMHYGSDRGLIDFVVGMAKGVGKYYNEDLAVTKLGSDRVQIVFP